MEGVVPTVQRLRPHTAVSGGVGSKAHACPSHSGTPQAQPMDPAFHVVVLTRFLLPAWPVGPAGTREATPPRGGPRPRPRVPGPVGTRRAGRQDWTVLSQPAEGET